MTGRGEAMSCPSFIASRFSCPSSGSDSLYILGLLSVITPSHHTLQPIRSCRFFANKTRSQVAHQLQSRFTKHHQLNNEELPPSRSSNFTLSGSVVTTSSRIAAASARALPAHAAHLSGWTHRLRACACAQHTLTYVAAPNHIDAPSRSLLALSRLAPTRQNGYIGESNPRRMVLQIRSLLRISDCSETNAEYC